MIFADLALARRLERAEAASSIALVEARNRLSPEVKAEWIQPGGACAMFDGPDSPITQTFGLGLFSQATPLELDCLEAFFRDRGAPVCHEVSPLAGVEVAELLSRRGYHPTELTNVLYLPLSAAVIPSSPNPRVQVRLMRDGEQEVWSQTSAQGWAEHPEYTEFLLQLGRVVACSDGARALFAELDGRPVATGLLRCHDGIAVFGGASTIAEARRQGAQRALLAARMQMALEHGCDVATIGAAPGSDSQRNAERQGFRIAYTRIKWRLD